MDEERLDLHLGEITRLLGVIGKHIESTIPEKLADIEARLSDLPDEISLQIASPNGC